MDLLNLFYLLTIFSFICLQGNQEADNKYECPICEYCSEKKICDPVRL